MRTMEERQSRKLSREYDILMRFYLEERAQNRHHEILIAFVAFQTLVAAGAIVAASVCRDVLIPGLNKLWLAAPAVVICGGALVAALLLQVSAIKHIDRSRWARNKIPWLDLANADKIGTAHKWIWRFYIGYFAALLVTSVAIVWKTAAIPVRVAAGDSTSPPRESP